MVLYTPLSNYDIFPNENNTHQLVTFEGRACYVRREADGTFLITQLISTDPQDFLNTKLMPGQMIRH